MTIWKRSVFLIELFSPYRPMRDVPPESADIELYVPRTI